MKRSRHTLPLRALALVASRLRVGEIESGETHIGRGRIRDVLDLEGSRPASKGG